MMKSVFIFYLIFIYDRYDRYDQTSKFNGCGGHRSVSAVIDTRAGPSGAWPPTGETALAFSLISSEF
jgi:hypothetical protein